MKKTVLSLCISLLVSCIGDSEALFESAPVPVIFSVGTTRAADATWTANDAVGVYVLPAGGTALSAATVSNRKYTVATNGAMTLAEGTAIYYPIDGTGVRFMAYYPYGTVSSYTRTFTFADQSTKAKKEAVDFCFHRGTTNYTRTSPATSLAFTHKFSKILLTVKQGAGGPDVSNVAVTLSNMPQTAEVNLATLATTDASAITTSGTATIAAYTNTTTSDKARTYTLPSDLAFEAGKVYAFDVTLEGVKAVLSDGLTNCYMVVPGKSVSFSISRAYMYDGSKFSSALHVDGGSLYTGEFEAAVVWDDNSVISGTPSVSGSGNSAVVTVNTTTNSGNAVVKIYSVGDESKMPVWSYHIWVTSYTGSTTHTNNGFTIMDRNLGATAAGFTTAARGLYYQWGRKDPFKTTGTVSTIATSVANGTIKYSILNPDRFIRTSSSPYDWFYGSERNNDLWGYNTAKTIYDPCPAGWRVPADSGMSDSTSPWYGLSSQNITSGTGANWGTNALYPFTGGRYSYNGAVQYTSEEGYYWMSSPYSLTDPYDLPLASCMKFIDYGDFIAFNARGLNNRAEGCPVRCVKE
jgi:hypothetical protein